VDFQLEPGPFTLLDPGSVIRLEGTYRFNDLVADMLDTSSGIDAAASGAINGVTDNVPGDFPATYQQTMGTVVDVVSDEIKPDPPSPAPQYIDAGNVSDGRRESVQEYLPDADTKIQSKFEPPPPPPPPTDPPPDPPPGD
jgi:hypothetical protein